MKNYFKNCLTLDEAKKLYYELCKVLHPDKGGKTEDFQAMANEFEAFKPQSEKFNGEAAQWNAKEYAHIIEQLIVLPGIVIEIVGSFIWLSGSTKEVKDQIKAVNVGESYKKAAWHKTKSMWFFSPTGYRKYSATGYSMDEIRGMYGSVTVNPNQKLALQA